MKPTQKGKYFNIIRCRVCDSERFEKVMDFGEQPLANAFLKKINNREYFFPLFVVFCRDCKTVQLGTTVRKDLMFKHYVYHSSTSQVFRDHFGALAQTILTRFNPKMVVDIGSNDGILLKPLKNYGVNAIGIEPSEEVGLKARSEGLPTVIGWIDDPEFVGALLNKIGPVDVITACNVFAHVHDIRSFVANVKRLLKEEGVFILEVSYIWKLIKHGYFDMIYHEHMFYWSITALSNLFKIFDMYIFDVEEVKTHGGSIRVYVSRKKPTITQRVRIKWKIAKEYLNNFNDYSSYKRFYKYIEQNKTELKTLLQKINKEGKKIIGYGAPAKSSTLLNYYGIGESDITCIWDDSKFKQGLYTPGKHIKVVAPDLYPVGLPDYILILAWNFAPSIIENLKKKGYPGKFIIPLPKPKIV